VVAVILSVILAALDHRYNHLAKVRSFLSVVIYPLQYAAELPIALGHNIADTLATRQYLQQQNERLQKENLMLRARLQQFDALESENLRLRDLVGSSFKIGDRVLIAELRAVDLDPYKQQVLINKGSLNGVFVGQPVLDANAVMGQVIDASPMSARVLLITDASHALPVQVNRNGLRSIAFGTGKINELSLPHLPNNADIREGDLLVTSGLGGHFPPGYPVAKVVEVTREPGEPFATVIATPSAHLERSREVLLVWTLSPPSIAGEAEAPQDEAVAIGDATGLEQAP